jgi:hypothetical protein
VKHEKIGTRAPENARPGLLGGSPVHIAENGGNVHLKAGLRASAPSRVRILKDRAFGHLIGSPEVIIERRNGSAFVSVHPRPWGWQNVDREFLRPDSPGVDRYALALVQRIHEAGKAKHLERERHIALRKAEREAAR